MADLHPLAVFAGSEKIDFFVQESPREPWHVETREHCEYMLCGKFISVDAAQSRVQYRWGPKKCFDCYVIYHRDIKPR